MLEVYSAEGSKDVPGDAVGVFVESKLGTERVGNSRYADPLGGDGDKGGSKERVAVISTDSAIENSGGQSLQHTVPNFIRAGKGKGDC